MLVSPGGERGRRGGESAALVLGLEALAQPDAHPDDGLELQVTEPGGGQAGAHVVVGYLLDAKEPAGGLDDAVRHL